MLTAADVNIMRVGPR